MSGPIAYFNGQFRPATEVAIALNDLGFIWGAVVTDRLRTFGGRLFRVAEHLNRFRQSCQLARIPQPVPDSELAAASEHIVRANAEGNDLAAVWVATPQPTLIAHTVPLDHGRFGRLSRDGARLESIAVTAGADARIKHRSRLAWWIAAQQIRDIDPNTEALFVDPATSHVLETPTANLLAVCAGVVTSPVVGTVLDGVSLGVIRELCETCQIPFRERAIPLGELTQASELLLANTSYCLAGVSSVDGRPLPFPGPILGRLLDAWSKLVGMDVRPPVES